MSLVDVPAPFSFSAAARLLAGEARRHGLVAPAFRSPPRLHGARRTIRRFADGTCLVSVRVRDREVADVIADLVEGVLVANGLAGQAAEGWRIALRSALAESDAQAA
jgi:hypothetical protein